jgi:type IX secretion system PorP/SprF family membrane protein
MKNILSLSIIISLVILHTNTLYAQDVHYTMYNAFPLYTNPATTGVFSGDIRAVINTRSQWGEISNPYKTYSFSVDGSLFSNKWRNGYLGIGLLALNDKAGASNFSTTILQANISSVLYLNRNSSLSVGISSAYNQKSLSIDNLEWDTQFNGTTYNAALPTLESFNNSSKSFIDFSTGILWAFGDRAKTISSNDNFFIQAGVGYHHLNKPNYQLNNGNTDNLYSKFVFHSEAHIGIKNSNFAIKPNIGIFLQGPTREYIVTTLIRYILKEESKYTGIFSAMAMSVGLSSRIGDAISPIIEFEKAKFKIGISYDVNVSKLSNATNGKGGTEIYIKFTNPNPFQYGRGTKSKSRFI